MCLTRTTITLTPENDERLKELIYVFGTSSSNVIGIAIKRLHTRIDDIKDLLEHDYAPIDIGKI